MENDTRETPMLARMEFDNGMTVRELKALVASLPERDGIGNDYEVWMMTGKGVSSPVSSICRLNAGDVLFGCRQWPA